MLHQRRLLRLLSTAAALCAMGGHLAAASLPAAASRTLTPIKHVIVILGENRTFDHIFATYEPVNTDEKVLNLLSEGIVKADGTPGRNYGRALQYQATDIGTYQISPPKTPYVVLPPALVGGPSTPYACGLFGVASGTDCVSSANAHAVQAVEDALAPGYVKYLLTGGTGQSSGQPDTRIQYYGRDANHLPPGPYQLTSASYPYDAYGPSPVHRFFQMWQELDCTAASATGTNPSGCHADLFPWVETSVGAGSNGAGQTAGFNATSTGEGSTAMGFFNVQAGDAPYLKELADQYTMSDNYHQAINGGTGANHVAFGTGDAIWFSDGQGNVATPPNFAVNPANPGTPSLGNTSALAEVENPNPQPGTNNYYIQDGYGGGSGSPTATAPKANYGGGSYVKCADGSQPGIGAILALLNGLVRQVPSRCDANHYYLVNNYNPGYFGDGSNAYTDTNPANDVFTIPPSTLRTIGDSLDDKGISWAYFGDHFNRYLADKYFANPTDAYCNICNWSQYTTSIMTNPALRTEHLKDTDDFYAGLAKGQLPAVSYIKPSGLVDGHPASSKLNLYEGFVKKIVDAVKADPTLWASTAIMVTFDEGGGYWDSGYVQPVDFFGDGTRVPMIVVSRFTKGGHINHTYTDHVSTLKFIERNWLLGPLTSRSRDNLPNPRAGHDLYVPLNTPAIGDMMDMFNFYPE